MPYCPLTVPHVRAHVRSVGNGFAVDITSDDDNSVRGVLARAEALTRKASAP
jgi:hypothetical protein